MKLRNFRRNSRLKEHHDLQTYTYLNDNYTAQSSNLSLMIV